MPRQIVINSTPQEARVALVEDSRLLEIFIERTRGRGITGNIYKGRVTRVLPGMQAAFVDIGLEKAAFLRAADFYPESSEDALVEYDDDNGSPKAAAPAVAVAESGAAPQAAPVAQPPPRAPIETLLKKGQEIIVQVANGPIGTKGARVTSHIAIPGRHLVYMPLTNHVGVSRRIEDPEERARLKAAVEELRPPTAGFIIRTACEGLSKREMQGDVRFLLRLWGRIQKKSESGGAPTLLHYDMDLILRSIRDLFTADIQRVCVDNSRDHGRIVEFLEAVMPRFTDRVELYTEREPIFDRFGIENQVNKALDRRVWLKSGGYIIIDHTEALTAIDVNTGRYVGKTTQEETVLKTNLEAAKTIVEQLRLRNIGGLIIIDFIDMEKPVNRKKVYDALSDAVRKDKARTNILHISELGLVEMTRKRRGENLLQLLGEPCPICDGRGLVRSAETVANEVLRRIRREAAAHPRIERLHLRVPVRVAQFLTTTESGSLQAIENEFGTKIVIEGASDLSDRACEVTAVEAAA
ncbi:MAG: ribonuclease E/G [Deltaproteobacteria bacterium]|nr:ribonuclease E/G [Deltaproteobacteria bacterium]